MALASVRRAVDADVDALLRIQSDTWRAAYAELVPAEALAQLSTPAAREAWRAAVGAGGGHHVFVAVEGEWTVGFCAAAHYGGENGAAIAEVSTLLVEPRWGRRGHGGRLLAAAADALRGHGSEMGVGAGGRRRVARLLRARGLGGGRGGAWPRHRRGPAAGGPVVGPAGPAPARAALTEPGVSRRSAPGPATRGHDH
jgi:L-amino acid N-acyltransferase YncA